MTRQQAVSRLQAIYDSMRKLHAMGMANDEDLLALIIAIRELRALAKPKRRAKK